MATYVAMTTQNEQMCGWQIVTIGLRGESRKAVEERAEAIILQDHGAEADRARDIYLDTDLKNLRVLPKSKVAPKLIENYEDEAMERAMEFLRSV